MTAPPEPETPAETVQALVSGRVQGVGFRFFVVQHARRLGLAGSVRNLADGRVEVRARGERAALELLLDQLRQGPRLSRVEGVAVEWGTACRATTGFDVGF
jgi:acylphosphatase